MRFLVFGASGMAGHTIVIYLTEQGHDVTSFSRQPLNYCDKVVIGDVLNDQAIESAMREKDYDVIVNCVGVLNQTAEEDKPKAVLLNSYLPHRISTYANRNGSRLIQMSTDCVFSGNTGGYQEDSLPDGKTFYDRTKALGEVYDEVNLTFRNSIIGPDINQKGIGLFNWFMKQSENISGFNKAIWTGVTTLTLAKAIEAAAEQNLTGIYHLVNNKTISKYELLKLFNYYFKENRISISSNDDVKADKSLINTRTDFDFLVPDYEEMILQMHGWIDNHKAFYPHYFE